MGERLTARVEKLRADFQAEKGYPFDHFFCPFLHVDEHVPLCEGHIINEEFGTCNAWVPQRQDFDSFYGSRVEADYISAVQDRSKTALQKWIDPKLSRRFKPQLLSKGVPLDHYFTQEVKQVPAQTPLAVVNPKGEMHSCGIPENGSCFTRVFPWMNAWMLSGMIRGFSPEALVVLASAHQLHVLGSIMP